jgi:5-methylcytosine-specific restriction protein A
MILARDPICKICDEATATIADHVEALDPGNPSAGNWSLSNGQGLCLPCHNAKTAQEQAGGGRISRPKEPGTGPQSNAYDRELKRKILP